MKHFFLLAALAMACVPAVVAAHASYLEEPEEVAPARPIVPPPPLPDNPLTEVVRHVTVGGGHTYKGLTVFPLTIPKVTDGTDYLSLSEALQEELLVITEKGRGSVPALMAENVSGRFILVLAGEVVSGGKQNRTLRQDVLLPPKSGKIELPVLCVERGRWSGRDMSFKKNPAMAALNVRAAAQAGESQEAVWSGVGYYQAGLNVTSGTEDLQAVTDSAEVQRALADYRSAFAGHWPPRAVGMVVARYWRIVGADLFCSPDVFEKHRDRLLESYAVDCYVSRKQQELTDRERIVPAPIGRREAERFLRRVLRAEHTWAPTPGAGRLLQVQGTGVNGLALVRDKAVVVHAGLFAQDLIRPLLDTMPAPPPTPRR